MTHSTTLNAAAEKRDHAHAAFWTAYKNAPVSSLGGNDDELNALQRDLYYAREEYLRIRDLIVTHRNSK